MPGLKPGELAHYPLSAGFSRSRSSAPTAAPGAVPRLSADSQADGPRQVEYFLLETHSTDHGRWSSAPASAGLDRRVKSTFPGPDGVHRGCGKARRSGRRALPLYRSEGPLNRRRSWCGACRHRPRCSSRLGVCRRPTRGCFADLTTPNIERYRAVDSERDRCTPTTVRAPPLIPLRKPNTSTKRWPRFFTLGDVSSFEKHFVRPKELGRKDAGPCAACAP